MSGPGGVGPLPSSRLTRVLQEKAEALRKKRQTAELLQKEVEDRIASLERLGIAPAGAAQRRQQLRELARRTDWEQLEAQAHSALEYLGTTVPATIENRRRRTEETVSQLTAAGVAVPSAVGPELAAIAKLPPDAPWSDTIGRLAQVDDLLRKASDGYLEDARSQALEVARWAGLDKERTSEFERRLRESKTAANDGGLAESLDAVRRLMTEGLPEAVARRQTVREAGTLLKTTAEELGSPVPALDAALTADADAPVERWPATVGTVESAMKTAGEALRGRSAQALESLRTSLSSLPEFGVDPGPARQEVEAAIARLPDAPPLEIGSLLAVARRAAEEPIVTVVAGLLDEVRPRIVAARRLGRDPTDVFLAMNRAREALRLKIYSEALAASQEALERVRDLTEDVDAARDELGSLEELIGRFRGVGFPTPMFDATLARIHQLLDRAEVEPARQALKETVRKLGKDAVAFFVERWTALDRAREFARERAFLPAGTDAVLTEAREALDEGDLSGAADRIARAEVELRAAAAPFVARRVEEMQQGFRDITDEALLAPVRRQLADADVTLRVKEDLFGAIESLRRAERDFSSVFAAHASALVEGLEEEVRTLQSMGGPGEEIQRQIDEVQQIFNMGDFVKASRASQEIRTRAQQQQLLRSEEAISHAKLSLVELETMGLDLLPLRAELEAAQSHAREGRFLEAYRTASRLEEAAVKSRGAAQGVLGRFARVEALIGRFRGQQVDPGPVDEPLANARREFRSLEFDRARGLLDRLEEKLSAQEAKIDTELRAREIALLIEDARRLAVPVDPYVARLDRLKTETPTAPAEATRTGVRLLHEELVTVLRPILEENLKDLERDLDVARSAGVGFDAIVPTIAEARRRIVLPVPTGAAALLEEVRAALLSTRGFVEQGERVARRVRESLAQAELLHVDVTALRPQAEQVDRLLAGRDYPHVVELGGTVERELLQSTYQHVSKSLAGFQAAVTQLRRSGGNTAVAENFLHQARMALDNGRAVEALQFAARSENEIERVDLQQRIAAGSLEATERAVARAAHDGVVGTEATNGLAAARAAFARGDFPEVLEQAIAVSEAVGESREGYRHAREALSAAERQLGEATGFGAETREGASRLVDARAEANAGHYDAATRLAREAMEMGRWAIERMFSGPIGELRREVESGRAEGLTGEIEPLDAVLSEAEAALRSGGWARVRTSLARADAASRRLFDEVVTSRWREVESEAVRRGTDAPDEASRKSELKAQLGRLKERRDLGEALRLLHSELDRIRGQRREEVARTTAEFRDRLWVGERLGVDTTPVMQTFSEARVALDANRFDEATRLLAAAGQTLVDSVRGPFGRKRKELQSEVTFAEEGLHVSVGPVKERLREVDELSGAAKLLDAARLMLKTEEELNLRKSLHRELTNLHYLLDAGLARAEEQGVDTGEARRLLAESLQLRGTDYAAALEKAREALRRLKKEGVPVTEPASAASSAVWPFRRPPSG